MPKIEELKRVVEYEVRHESGTSLDLAKSKITLAAIEDAQRYKKDENGMWICSQYGMKIVLKYEEIPAAVRAVLEVTGGGE